MTHFQRLAVFVALAAIGYAGCGRSDLDEGFPTEPITTGSAGSGPATGSGGSGGQVGGGSGGQVGSGTGARPGSGTGGQGGIGSGGRPGTGNIGGTGGRPNTGSAGANGGSGGRPGSGGSVGTGSGGNVGTGGNAGTGGGSGTGGGPGGIACGAMTCALGAQTCCVQSVNGIRTEACQQAGTPCAGGNVGCVAGDCTDGRICCLSIVGLATSCATPAQCTDGLSTVLCRNNGDCPSDRRFCCPSIGINICRNYRCPGN